jgi:hypothetical protein
MDSGSCTLLSAFLKNNDKIVKNQYDIVILFDKNCCKYYKYMYPSHCKGALAYVVKEGATQNHAANIYVRVTE